MSNIQDDVRELVLGFFRVAGADISQSDGIYHVIIPDGYRDMFQAGSISIAFEESTSSGHDYELVIPGSKVLTEIINACAKKGPIAIRKHKRGATTIRYHFFIQFSGLSSISILDYVDVDLESSAPKVSGIVSDHVYDQLGQLIPKLVTSTYSLALDKLQERHDGARVPFLEECNRRFVEDVATFTKRHDTHMRQLNDTIREKEKNSDDFAKVQEFRFETVEMMKRLEEEKIRLLDTLQKKHKIILEYSLVACEVFINRQC